MVTAILTRQFRFPLGLAAVTAEAAITVADSMAVVFAAVVASMAEAGITADSAQITQKK